VSLNCADDDAQGEALEIFWSAEPDRRILEKEAWGSLGQQGFDLPRRFAAYVNALRWNSVTATDPRLFQSPFRAGIQLDAYQLEPLRMALAMPRVQLFIADDTGLGKTIEAGLILRELLLRKKAKTVVVAAPASVLEQWRVEMEDRFGLRFRILDRNYFAEVRQDHGYGVNPWRTTSLFLVSHNLLISDIYAGPMREWLGERLPGSLFVLDEAHHAAPARGNRYAIDSKLTRAVRDISGRFEHRLFLSATPHNGHSNSFSALMEILDPYRFTRGVKLRGNHEQSRLRQVMVRRLKNDIRELQGGFPKRIVECLEVSGLPEDAPELVLSRLLNEYRDLREQRFARATTKQQASAALLTIGLQQRLLSSIEAFALSLARHRKTTERQWAKDAPAVDPDDSFLHSQGAEDDEDSTPDEEVEIELLNQSAEAGLSPTAEAARLRAQERKLLEKMAKIADRARGLPDAKTLRLLDWIRENQCPGMAAYGTAPQVPPARWTTRRVIIFTENRQGTKQYLRNILSHAIRETDRASERIEIIDGMVAGDRRREIQRRFNTPPEEDPLRILLATDAAREGLNFQAHCSDLFHFDLPWNPGRMEQRNGRIDRKLQQTDEVHCRYFKLPQRPEDHVLDVLARKTETIKRELGSLSRVLDDDIEQRLKRGIRHQDADRLAREIEGLGADAKHRQAAEAELADARDRQDTLEKANETCRHLLERSRKWVGYDERAFRDALSCSLEILGAAPLRSDDEDVWQFPDLAQHHGWESALDALRRPRKPDQKLAAWRQQAAVHPVVFEEPGRLTEAAVHLHLEHRIARRLLSRFRAQGFIHHDLSRACLVQTRDAVPRVLLLGRLCLFGGGAERLHEELTVVAARWRDPARRTALQRYAREAEAQALDLLKQSLVAPPGNPPAPVAARFQASAERDIAELLPGLEEDAREREQRARTSLERRGEKEAQDLTEVLQRQRGRVAERLAKWEEDEGFQQLSLFGDLLEKRQLQDDVRAWKSRIEQFDQEVETEPERIREFYRVKASRFEPVGLAYLWPRSN